MKTYIKIFLYSLIMYVCLSMISTYSLWWRAVIESIAYVALTLWMLKKYPQSNRRLIYTAILAGLVFFEIPIRILHFESTSFNLIHSLCTLWAFIITVLYCEYKRMLITILGCLIWLFGMTEGIARWQEYVNHERHATKEIVNVADCRIEDTNGTFPLGELKADYILLDFWASSCTACIKKFPELQELSEMYQQDSTVFIASIFVKNEKRNETIATGKSIVEKKECSFPVFSIANDNPLIPRAQVMIYPTVIILDKSHNVVFKGSLKFAKRKLEKLTSKQLTKP